MSGDKQVFFPPFSLDISNQHLQRGSEKISLRPKTLSVLAHLVEHPHRLISKEELTAATWPTANVVNAALRVSIQEIRKALGDSAENPRFIETVGKRGYRFMAPVNMQMPSTSGSEESTPFVGRDAELSRLQHHFELANGGKRQVVLVTGEPGIGKSTLIGAFLKTLPATFGVIGAVGLCVEQYGAGEAYLPILDILEQMCNLPICDTVIEHLRQYAPSWLVGLPVLVSGRERAELARQTAASMPEPRMREIATFLEAITKLQPVILVLEDLHWADPSTLALISFVARRRESARLMLVGTYRENEVEHSNHLLKGVKTELQLHHYCSHLPLKLLHQEEVGEYLAARFEAPISVALRSIVYQRSEGNPLFMINITDYFLGRGAIAQKDGAVQFSETGQADRVPETIRDLIERQVSALIPEDQELLEAASIAGPIFSTVAISSLLKRSREQTEDHFRALAESTHFIQEAGVRRRPGGRGTPRYSFVHSLYQNVIYERVGAAKRRRLHQRIGELTEAAYAGSTETVAAELATYFESSGDGERAVKYMLQAAQRSFSVCAYPETIDYATKALALADSLPPAARQKELELNLQLLVAVAICASKGYAAKETGYAFERAGDLSRNVNNDELLFESLAGIWSYYLVRGMLGIAQKRAQELLAIAQRMRQPGFLLNAHIAVASAHFYQGRFQVAHDHFTQALPHYDFQYYRSKLSLFSWDPGVLVYCYDAQALWFLGFPERAEKSAKSAVALAKQLVSPFNEALCYAIHATYYSYRREAGKALEMAEAALRISNDRGFRHWAVLGSFNKGWGLCKLGNPADGLPLVLEGLTKWKAMGAEMAVPTFQVLLGEIYQAQGKFKKALSAVEEGLAIAARNNDRHYDAELYRLKGELLLQIAKRNRTSDFAEAEACFLSAVDIARKQKALILELRATLALARLWKTNAKIRQASQMLKKIYRQFTEGFDTPDLERTKTLLDELS
jgi:DNA-binding winged helix-turn-helix (wHTH) protein/predicted ATPase